MSNPYKKECGAGEECGVRRGDHGTWCARCELWTDAFNAGLEAGNEDLRTRLAAAEGRAEKIAANRGEIMSSFLDTIDELEQAHRERDEAREDLAALVVGLPTEKERDDD